MFDQRIDEAEPPAAQEQADEGRRPEAPRRADGFRCYSLEVLLLLED